MNSGPALAMLSGLKFVAPFKNTKTRPVPFGIARFWWMLLLVGSISGAASEPNFERVLRGWETGDCRLFGDLNPPSYAEFGDAELRRLLPELAKWIPITRELAVHGDQSWRAFKEPHEWTPFWNALPLYHPLRVRHGQGMEAASLIAYLVEQKRIQDPAIFPELIEGLENPPDSSTNRDCFRALTQLTRIYDGPLTSWSLVRTAEHRRLVADWFRTWHGKMAGRKMSVTSALLQSIKREFLSVTCVIESQAVAPGHALHGYKSPDEKIYHEVGEPLFYSSWTGSGDNRAVIMSAGQSKPLYGMGWMFACVRVQTSLLHEIEWWDRYKWDTVDTLPKWATLIFSRKIEGTDWAIEVYVKDVPIGQVWALRNALAATKDGSRGSH
ncbi:MAG: hypothetical protein H2172_10230 [Opitutus sp.]|nr:hypothetical protein [Opitutus sp.]MCS6247432.1 hypothetical protein [Opitutus sp.]MCS6273045.1 hypothetical protein [Opitutus sp.]MCS6276727.1 hypothetical protein [Opitutus sp.]MCS6301624.1 hypothetical protein [Opitutus sp.]